MRQIWFSADVNGKRQVVGCIGQSGLFTRKFANVGTFYKSFSACESMALQAIERPRAAGLESFDSVYFSVHYLEGSQ